MEQNRVVLCVFKNEKCGYCVGFAETGKDIRKTVETFMETDLIGDIYAMYYHTIDTMSTEKNEKFTELTTIEQPVVRGVPTIMIYIVRKGKLICTQEYTGAREKNAIFAYINAAIIEYHNKPK